MIEDQVAKYHFGPLEKRGLIAGWRGGQIASVGLALILALIILSNGQSTSSLGFGIMILGCGAGFACWPINGKSAEEWFPTVVSWVWSSLFSSRISVAQDPQNGIITGTKGFQSPLSQKNQRRGLFAGLELLEAESERDGSFGVIYDARERTYLAAIKLHGHSFALLSSEEKEHRVASWGSVLASLSQERSVIERVQWIASGLPDNGMAVRAHFEGRSTLAHNDLAYRSYTALLRASRSATCFHDVHLTLKISGVRNSGRGHRTACLQLEREIALLSRMLRDADVTCDRVLSPRALRALIKRASAKSVLSAVGGQGNKFPSLDLGAKEGIIAPGSIWPMATEDRWGMFRADATWHAIYWIAEWPRIDIGPDFLGPLLLGADRRTVSVVMEPLESREAVRQVERARVADVADSELRRRGGFLATARRAREAEIVTRREAELAEGHASFRFSGYVSVTANSCERLEEACEGTEQAASQCRLELRRLWGDQARGFTCLLPLARGLSS